MDTHAQQPSILRQINQILFIGLVGLTGVATLCAIPLWMGSPNPGNYEGASKVGAGFEGLVFVLVILFGGGALGLTFLTHFAARASNRFIGVMGATPQILFSGYIGLALLQSSYMSKPDFLLAVALLVIVASLLHGLTAVLIQKRRAAL
jgi:hypothetical protein